MFVIAPAYADAPVNAWLLAVLGKIINSVPEFSCKPTAGVDKGLNSGRRYMITHCQSGDSYAVHFKPDGTDAQVMDCANLRTVGTSCDDL